MGTQCYCALLLFVVSGFLCAAEEANIRHFRENGTSVSEGSIDTAGWAEGARKSLLDLGRYNDWGLKWMDGNDPHSAAFWVHLKDYHFTAPDIIELTFDLNMGWPFGSKGNHARFRLDQAMLAKNTIRLVMDQPPFGLDAAGLILKMPPPGQTQDNRLIFRLEMKFWGIVEALMDYKKFQESMGWRLNRMQENLKEYVQSQVSATAANRVKP